MAWEVYQWNTLFFQCCSELTWSSYIRRNIHDPDYVYSRLNCLVCDSQPQAPGAKHYHTLAGEPQVFLQKSQYRACSHHAGLVPSLERDAQVAGARREYDSIVLESPAVYPRLRQPLVA